jgi:hypothetical protein
MMKFYSSLALIKFSWDQVATGFWSRYPNPYSSHVLTEDTIQQGTSGGRLLTKRLLTKTNHLPRWGERFVPGPRSVVVVEESIIDPINKTMTTYTRNIGYTSIMSIEEKCTYRSSPENGDWTEMKREACINSSVYGFSYALQKFGLERFKSNAAKSLKGFNIVLNRLYPASHDNSVHQTTNKEKLKNTAEAAKKLAASVVATN